MNVTFYKWENLQAVDGWDPRFGYSLVNREDYGFIESDNGTEFALPVGYELINFHGEMTIFDDKDQHCHIAYGKIGPVLESTTRRIQLKAVQA